MGLHDEGSSGQDLEEGPRFGRFELSASELQPLQQAFKRLEVHYHYDDLQPQHLWRSQDQPQGHCSRAAQSVNTASPPLLQVRIWCAQQLIISAQIAVAARIGPVQQQGSLHKLAL